MFPTTKIINYTLVVVTSSLFLQQFCYVFFLVEAKAYDQRRSRYSTQQSQAQMYGGQNSAMTVNHRRGDSSGMDECNSEIGNKTHTYTIKVPNDALDSYAIIKVLQKNLRHTEIKICCPGYNLERNLYGDVCTPVCDDCRNGHCVGPNECECFDGFVRNDNGDCVFSCPLGCLNGRCYLDETCKCDPGYKLDETRRFCRPICSKGCGSNLLLNCTEPEVCSCINGYMLTETGCRAVCSPDCGPGGKCNVHGVCVCEPGYTLKEGVCHSTCYQSCENGMCYSRHRCICNPGYVYMENTGNCEPRS